MLEANPIRNISAIVTANADDTVTVKVKRKRPKYLVPPLSWILIFRPYRTTDLDRLGSAVWKLCDGKTDVEAIVDGFAEQYDLTFHEARVSVTGYLKDLIQRGIMAIAIEEQKA
jgi:hypothetical protein